ncbi:MAG: heme exporter protein CcmB [Acidimicrobiia bacterium]|nr:heme exporter protein CcmB [Acidimicrobiia bacterium]
MRFWRTALRIAMRDLRIEGRSGEVLLTTIPFGLAALFLIPLALPLDRQLIATVGPGMFWIVTLLFGMFVTFRQSAVESPAQRETLRLLGVDPAARFTGRVITSALLLVVFEAVLAPATVVLYAPEPIDGWPLLAALGIALIGTMAVDVTAGLRGRTSLAPLLVAPLSVPLLMPAASAAAAIRRGDGIVVPALLMGFAVLALAILGVMTAHSLEEASG